jgi:hypothetical protein
MKKLIQPINITVVFGMDVKSVIIKILLIKLPKWEQRLNKRINNIRRDLGRITQYLKGINSNHLNNCINPF